MPILINRKHQICHKILHTLSKYNDDNHSPGVIDAKEFSLLFSELVERSNLNENDVSYQLDYVIYEQEVFTFEQDFNDYYYITQKGKIAYNDKKHLTIGRREFWNDTYDIIKTISAIVILIIAVITFINNLIETKENKKEIKSVKIELQKLKESTKISPTKK